jgi:tRNA(Ile)-lysidine synthase
MKHSDHSQPIAPEEFAALMEPLAPKGPLAVAVSGGADSMALLCLAARWGKHPLTALTVDHGLRAESAEEARRVKAWAAALGVAHVTLVWRGEKPKANLQAAARAARYGLLADWCREAGAQGLLLAHTLNDQAETVLLRLARGSGVNGLAAMAPVTQLRGIVLLRPLLGVSRARILATLRALGQDWIEDPSNDNARFARVRLRKAQAVLADAGLTPERLAATATRMARARAALETHTTALLESCAQWDSAGFCALDTQTLAAAPEEIGLRALARIVMAVGGLDVTPRLERLERLYARLCKASLGRGATLGGCRIIPDSRARRRGSHLVLREAAAIAAQPLPLAPGEEMLWDHRFRIRLAGETAPGTVKALGQGGLALVRQEKGQALALPAPVRPTLPSLWRNGRLAAVPHLGFTNPSLGLPPGAFSAEFIGI